MMKLSDKTKKIVAIIVVAFFLLVGVLPLSSLFVNAEQTKAEQKEEIKNEISEIETQQSDVMTKKKQMDDEIHVITDDITNLEGQIQQDDEQIGVLEDELDVATQAAEEQYETYKTRVRVMYEHGSQGYLEVLLSADSLTDFLNRFELIKEIAEYDKDISDQLEQTRQTIADTKASVEQVRQEKVEKTNTLEAKRDDLNAKVAESDQMIQALEADKEKLEQQLQKIEAEEQQTRMAAAAQGNTAIAYSGGQMEWPAPGYYNITSEYGYRIHPVLGYRKLHTGMDIGAPYGARAVAANDGTVVTATYNGAYGNYVIVDHGGGIMTLYAHGSRLTVSKGQKVTRGQQVLVVGSTGYSTGAHLHFEVLVNGSTTNPRNYLQ